MFSSSSSPVILLISGRFSGAEALPNTTLLTLVDESSKQDTQLVIPKSTHLHIKSIQ